MYRASLIVCAMLALCQVASAQHCSTGFAFKSYGYSTASYGTVYHNTAYVAPVVIVPDISYSPAVALQLASVKTNYVRTDADYSRFLQFKAYEAGVAAASAQRLQYAAPQQQTLNAGAAGASVVPTVNNAPPAPAQQSVAVPQRPQVLGIVQHCGRCHGAQLETPKGNPPIYIDPTKQLTGDDILRAVRVMRLPENDPNVMPPAPAKLTADDKGGIFEELLSLQIGGSTR